MPKLEQVCYSAAIGRERKQRVFFVTERAVFGIGEGGLELIEIAPGLDAQRDVIAHMGFTPKVSPTLKPMDRRIFEPGLMGLGSLVRSKPRGYRSARVAMWHESRKMAAK